MLPFCSDVWDRTSPPRDDVGVTAHTQGGSTPRHDCVLRPFTEESRGSNGRIPCLWPEVRNCVKSLRFNYTRSLSPDMFFLVRGLQITAESRSKTNGCVRGGVQHGWAWQRQYLWLRYRRSVKPFFGFNLRYPQTPERLLSDCTEGLPEVYRGIGDSRTDTLIMIISSRFCRPH
jgi:hypothetical protein